MSADGNNEDKDELSHFWQCKSDKPPTNFVMLPRVFSQQFDSNFHNQPPDESRLKWADILHTREREFDEAYRKAVESFLVKQKEDEEQLRRQMELAVVAALNASADSKIERLPGHRLIGVLRAVMPNKVYERVFGQMVADSWDDYNEAIAQGDHSEAKKIKRYLNYYLLMSIVEYLSGLPFHFVSKWFGMFNKSE